MKTKSAYIKSSTNSEIGSYHWFHTIISKHKDIGEFLKENLPDESLLKIWGEELYNTSRELIEGYEKINKSQLSPVVSDEEIENWAKEKFMYDHNDSSTNNIVDERRFAAVIAAKAYRDGKIKEK